MLVELKNIGLSDKEAKVYLAMLELGPATMLEIAAKANVNRPTAYVQIESLKKMGLVSTHTKGNKKLFTAESPTQLEFILNQEEKIVEQKRDQLQKVLVDLIALYNLAEEKPLVRYFEGKEGLLRMQEEFLKTKDKMILGIFSVDDLRKVFPDHPNTYTPRRVQKKIRSRSIYTSTAGPVLDKDNKNVLRETKYVSPEKLPISTDLTIFDNHIAISSLKGKIGGTIISHPEIASSFKAIFNFLWNTLDKA